MRLKQLLTLFGIAALIAFSTDFARSGEAPMTGQSKAGRLIYERGCAICHGAEGKGDGMAAPYLDPRPRDFTRGEFKLRTTPNGSVPTAEDLTRTINHGLNGTAMSPWAELSKQDMQAVIAYIQTFSERFKGPSPTPITIPPQTPFSEEAMKRGQHWYTELECWKCHGTEGHGDGPSAPELKDSREFPIRPTDLTYASRYKRGASPTDIYLTIFTGLTGTPMPSYAGTLEKPQNEWDLVYYVYWLSQEKSFANALKALKNKNAPLVAEQQTWVK